MEKMCGPHGCVWLYKRKDLHPRVKLNIVPLYRTCRDLSHK